MTKVSNWSRNLLGITAAMLFLLPAAGQAREDYATAARQHQEGRWSGAYGRFIVAGRNGDAAAADAALFMHRFGPLLYRTPWDMSTEEAEDFGMGNASASDQSKPPPPMLDAAASYRKGELGASFAKFSAFASQGNPDAARVALFMHLHGPALYGRYWAASPEEVRRWRELGVAAATSQPRRPAGSMMAKRAH